jgi:hypothetical protein
MAPALQLLFDQNGMFANHADAVKIMFSALQQQGVFHGLSYEYVVGKLGTQLGSRAIVAHRFA